MLPLLFDLEKGSNVDYVNIIVVNTAKKNTACKNQQNETHQLGRRMKRNRYSLYIKVGQKTFNFSFSCHGNIIQDSPIASFDFPFE